MDFNDLGCGVLRGNYNEPAEVVKVNSHGGLSYDSHIPLYFPSKKKEIII